MAPFLEHSHTAPRTRGKRRQSAYIHLLHVFLLCTGFLAAHFTTAAPAQAYTHLCGPFWGVGGNDPISYRYYDVSSTYYNAFKSNGDPQIEVRDKSYAWSDWARATWKGCTAGYWLYDEIQISFNTRTMGGLSAREKKIVAEHEPGHAYGLNHVSVTCSNPGPAVMRQGTGKFGCGGDGPWYDDVQGVMAKY